MKNITMIKPRAQKIFSLCMLLLLFSLVGRTQTIRVIHGVVQDTSGLGLPGALVKLDSTSDSLIISADENGRFTFQKITAAEFSITASFIGFFTFTQKYITEPGKTEIQLDTIRLKESENELTAVTINGLVPVTVKEDTIEYNAAAYKVRAGAMVEDVVKKLPGVTVDKDGNVAAQGTQVTTVRVNGTDYMGGDVQAALQNLPADIIQNIQVIDDYGKQANLTGIKTGEPQKIINVTIQKDKNRGTNSNTTLAGGDNDRYLARLNIQNFKDKRRLAFTGLLNNTNTNAFNFDNGNRNNDGITSSQSLGIEYQDQWTKKILSRVNYKFSGNQNNTISNSYTQDFNPLNTIISNRANNNNRHGASHNVSFDMEYKMDTLNYFEIEPYFSYYSSSSDNLGTSQLSRSKYSTFNNNKSAYLSSSPNFGGDLNFNHRFKKKGRNFNINTDLYFYSGINENDSRNVYNNIDSTQLTPLNSREYQYQDIESRNRNQRTSIRVSYTEPLAKSTFLELSYSRNRSGATTTRDVDDIDPATNVETDNLAQSNNYSYTFTINRLGLNLRTQKKKYNYTIGILAQPSALRGLDIGRNIRSEKKNFNIIPTARFTYNFEKSHTLSLNYDGSSNEPNFQQLQPVRDSSSLNNIIIGNPNLNSEFTNRFRINYRKSDNAKGNSLFANFSYHQTQNKIVSSLVDNLTGTGRTTSYTNVDGFYTLSGDFSYTRAFAQRKYSITIGGYGSFDNNISFRNSQQINGQRWYISPRTSIRIDLEDIIDLDLNANYSVNRSTSRYPASVSTTEAKTLNLGVRGKSFFFKDWTLGYDYTKQLNYGYRANSTNPNLLSLYFERRFLKDNAGTVRLQGFDLFNESTGIQRSVNGTSITDSQNNRLARYLLLSFNLRIRKFAGR